MLPFSHTFTTSRKTIPTLKHWHETRCPGRRHHLLSINSLQEPCQLIRPGSLLCIELSVLLEALVFLSAKERVCLQVNGLSATLVQRELPVASLLYVKLENRVTYVLSVTCPSPSPLCLQKDKEGMATYRNQMYKK